MYFQKSYDVVGYAADADIYCADCLPYDPEGEDSEGNPVTPIFADDEFDYQPCCSMCGAEIECVMIEAED